MRMEVTEPDTAQQSQPGTFLPPREAHWDLAFVGIMGYLVVEYMRLSAQYQFLLPFQVGKVVIAVTLLGWLISHQPSGGDRSPVRRIDLALVFMVFASFLSACFASDQDPAWRSFFDLFRWALIYFLIGRIVNNPWRLRLFVFLFLLLNLKMAQAAIRSYGVFKQSGASDELIAKLGVGAGSVGFFSNQGDFGVAMCVVWPLAGMLLIGEEKKISRIIFLVCLLGFTGATFVSSSRGALLALAVTAAIGWIRNPKRILAGLIVALLLLAGVYLLPGANKARLQSALHPESDSTVNIRLNLWRAGLDMFTSHPILGVGPGNFPSVYYSQYPKLDASNVITAPHNIFIQASSELGLMGTLPLLAMMLFLFRLNARTRKMLRTTGEAGRQRLEYRLATALDLALIAYVVSGSFLTVLYYPHLWVLLGMSVGVYNCCARMGATQADSRPDFHQGHLTLAAQ